jgi:hypothetical protein
MINHLSNCDLGVDEWEDATTNGPAHIGYEEGVLQLLLKQGT